jgi:chromodomain-helicase-DNA-binding protein 4
MKVRRHLALIHDIFINIEYILATWDAPPRPTENNYESFKRAFDRFIDSRNVLITKQSRTYWRVFDDRAADGFKKQHLLRDASKLELGSAPNLKLLPFQVSSRDT